jgi:hypothetical protein
LLPGESLLELGLPDEWSLGFWDAPEYRFALAEW